MEGPGGQMELSCEALGSFLKATGMQRLFTLKLCMLWSLAYSDHWGLTRTLAPSPLDCPCFILSSPSASISHSYFGETVSSASQRAVEGLPACPSLERSLSF